MLQSMGSYSCATWLGFYRDGISFQIVFSQSFCLRVLPGGAAQMDASEKDSGRWSDICCLLLTLPELFRLVVAYQFRVPYQDLLS